MRLEKEGRPRRWNREGAGSWNQKGGRRWCFGATGRDSPGWLDHSPQSVFAELRRPRGGCRGRGSVLPQSLLEASPAPLVDSQKSQDAAAVLGPFPPHLAVKASRAGQRFTRSFRKRVVSAYCVPLPC